ncbi:orotate phosphoribosyltransferase [Candidatus Parcubacteria bacterium]|nr:MAG: orotate phosphoribosyltransferase [Candidatus Parcubacteria bacterium]
MTKKGINIMDKKKLILKLNEIGAIKFGEFKLVTGIISPIYLTLRTIISYPDLMKAISEEIYNIAKDLKFDLIVGVPYTALPLATVISAMHDVPMIIRRKEMKDHGIQVPLEGVYKKGQTVLVIEDLITSGTSVFGTTEPIEKEGLKVTDVIVVLNREQGGKKLIEQRGYKLHSIFTMSDMVNTLLEEGKIDSATKNKVDEFIKANQF